MSAMTRRNIFLPEEMWAQLLSVAVELTSREGKPVSVSDALRRILERSLKRRGS
jgi:hypothetical protein